MAYFEYGNTELDYLARQDEKLGEAMKKIGMINREITPQPFAMLLNSIVGQQISGRAAETVWNRFVNLCGDITPEKVGSMDLSEIQACGMSMRKAGYIRGVADACLNGSVNFSAFSQMSDNEIIHTLTKLHGVGVWTAEMLLIFSMGRPDIVSFNDFGIRKGMMKLYGLEKLPKEVFDEYRRRYSPYGTTASFYLWEIAAL